MIKIAGVVIVYYPDIEKLKHNIKTYIDQVEKLFVFFNSPAESTHIEELSFSTKIEFIFNQENIGVAAALNRTAGQAIKLGYLWLLTMDQDSFFRSDTFFELFNRSNKDLVAICSPDPVPSDLFECINDVRIEEVLYVITSGNLLNLDIWKKIGGFEEKLFIDEVDHEYCLKAVSKGYKILKYKNIPLSHELGQEKEVSLVYRKFCILVHPPIRNYYIFRNNFYIFKKYRKEFPAFIKVRRKVLLKNLFKIVLFSPERIKNCVFIFYGIRDYYRGVYGSYMVAKKS